MREYTGRMSAEGRRFGIVVSRFNEMITDRLLSGALDALRRHGAADDDIDVVRVPGAWEIPVALDALAKRGGYDALLALGAVIRGGTPHFDYVCGQAMSGSQNVAVRTGVPVALGLLTTDTIEQAIERAGTKAGNKGWEAAVSAIETANVLSAIAEEETDRS